MCTNSLTSIKTQLLQTAKYGGKASFAYILHTNMQMSGMLLCEGIPKILRLQTKCCYMQTKPSLAQINVYSFVFSFAFMQLIQTVSCIPPEFGHL
jgi:hypothetical protein